LNSRVLITGGAGFIGSRLARKLLSAGHEVSILDSFSPQIHGENRDLANDIRDHVKLFRGDIRDVTLCERALAGQQTLIHLAAETGTGQSMYQVRHYSDVNISGTAILMELLLASKHSVQNLIVASSRAIYGEGAAFCAEHGLVYPLARRTIDMKSGNFEPRCPQCDRYTTMASTTEAAIFHPSSMYGLTKQVQEQMILLYAATLGINGFALRYQNVYGPGQSLKNPYTGILAIFSNQARANEPIYIFEDGKESRDFVYIDDVVEATYRCVDAEKQPPVALNVGTGVAVTVNDVVQAIVRYFGSSSKVSVNGAFREGDIRHACADITKLQQVLGFTPTRPFSEGIGEFLAWASAEPLVASAYEKSLAELKLRGLMSIETVA